MIRLIKNLIILVIVIGAVFAAYKYFTQPKFNPDDIRDEINKEVVIYTSQINTDIPINNGAEDIIDKIVEALKPGERDIIVPVKITVKSVIRCNKIEDIDVDEDNRMVRLILPDPEYQVDGVVIDWDNITQDVPWYRANFSKKEISELVEKAVIENTKFINAHKGELDATANANAEKALKAIIGKFGFNAEIGY